MYYCTHYRDVNNARGVKAKARDMQDQGKCQGHRPKAKAKAENGKVDFSSKCQS